MSSFADMTAPEKEELAVSLAVLACHDAEIETSAENLSAALNASGNTVAPYLPTLFSNLLKRGLDVEDFLAGPSAGGSSAAPAAGGAAPAAEEKKEEEEEEEEADLGGGMDMFGGGDDY